MNTSQKGIIAYFFLGFVSPFRALTIVKSHKDLIKYFIVPFFLNVFLLSALFYFSYMYSYPWLQGFIPDGGAWYLAAIRWITGPVLIVILGIICIFIYSITGYILIAPFNDPLSGAVEEKLRGRAFNESFSIKVALGDIVRGISNSIKMLILVVLFNLVIFSLNLIPVAGSIIYSGLSFLSVLFFFGFGFFDFPLERRKQVFRQKLKYMWKYKSLIIGLGLSFFLLTFIPILGFLIMNLATVGATDLFIKYFDMD